MNGSSAQSTTTTAATLDQVWWNLIKCELEFDTTTVALFARACGEHVLPFYQVDFPNDDRPGRALEAIGTWLADRSASPYAVFDQALDDANAASNSALDIHAPAAYY